MQSEEGLQTYCLHKNIHQHAQIWENVFVIGKGLPVTANSLIESFDVVYSVSQMERELEADTYTYFCVFIHNVDMKVVYICGCVSM